MSASLSEGSPDWDSVLEVLSDRRDIETLPAAAIQVPTPPPHTEMSSPPLLASQLLDLVVETPSPVGDPVADDDVTISVSTAFLPGATLCSRPPDLVLLSSDSTHFYVHFAALLDASSNSFDGLLQPYASGGSSSGWRSPLTVAEPSDVLNVVLHAVYERSCSHYAPSLECLSAAMAAMGKYGLPVQRYTAPSTPLFSILLSHAPLNPIELYALAAEHDLDDLAVPVSSHLLSFHLPSISEEMVDRIGARYLKRLFFLHLGRTEVLKRILLQPPRAHTPTATCSIDDQRRGSRAWAFASAQLAWEARPDLSIGSIESVLDPLEAQVPCGQCRERLRERMETVKMQWSSIKRTI